MSRLKVTPVPGLLMVLHLFAGAAAAQSDKPNVLLIITDEHNFRTLGCYRAQLPADQAEMWGAGVVVPTPHIDRLAAEGVLCTRAYATAPVCSPCRASLFTGRYPHRTGVPTNNRVLDSSIPTLADRLQRAGYRTAYFGKWHLAGDGKPQWAPEVDGGFEFTNYMFNRGHWKKLIDIDGQPAVGASRNGVPTYALDGAGEETFTTDFLTDRSIQFMTDRQAHQERPFFAVVSYPDPHGPNTVRPPYDHMFDHLRFAAPRTYDTGLPAPRWLGGGKNHAVFRGDEMSRYFGMVKCIDDNIGQLLESLEHSGQLARTLVIFTSDHGDLCYEHDRLNKGNPYEGSARVPMIFRLPGEIDAGRVYSQPIGSVDVTPTVMGLLALSNQAGDEGRDLSREISSDERRDGREQDPPMIFLRNAGDEARWVAAVDPRYKLVLSTSDVPWLFDHHQDPDELLNYFGRGGPDAQAAAVRLARGLREHGQRSDDPFLREVAIAASLAGVLGKSPAAASQQIDGERGDSRRRSKKRQERQGARRTETVPDQKPGFRANWQGSRRWIGPQWWANPLTDWSLRDGVAAGAAAVDRTLCLLTAEIDASGDDFQMRVTVQRKASPGKAEEDSRAEPAARQRGNAGLLRAGFRIGRRGGIDD